MEQEIMECVAEHTTHDSYSCGPTQEFLLWVVHKLLMFLPPSNRINEYEKDYLRCLVKNWKSSADLF